MFSPVEGWFYFPFLAGRWNRCGNLNTSRSGVDSPHGPGLSAPRLGGEAFFAFFQVKEGFPWQATSTRRS